MGGGRIWVFGVNGGLGRSVRAVVFGGREEEGAAIANLNQDMEDLGKTSSFSYWT